MLSILLGVTVSLLTIKPIHSLGLGELVDLAADDSGDKLLGKGVADWFACLFKSKLEDCSWTYQLGI